MTIKLVHANNSYVKLIEKNDKYVVEYSYKGNNSQTTTHTLDLALSLFDNILTLMNGAN